MAVKKSNTKAVVVAGTETSGAAYAQRFIDRVRADPTSEQLESWIGYAEHAGAFNGSEDELLAFYSTLQRAIAATPSKVSESDIEHVGSDMGRVASMIHSILGLAKQMERDDLAGIEALCEKAGTLADRCAVALGDVPVCGAWENWTDLEWPDTARGAETREARHG